MGDNKQELAWLLLWARLGYRTEEEPDGGRAAGIALSTVSAWGGTLRDAPARSANDQVIAALLIFLWFCAIYRANAARFWLNQGRFVPKAEFAPISLAPSIYAGRRAIGGSVTLCQLNSTPTVGPVTIR